MKKFIVALSLTVASLASYASVITEYRSASDFPSPQNDLGFLTVSGNANGNNNSAVNLTYTFNANTAYVGFDFTASHFDKLFVEVTAADKTIAGFDRIITGDEMFWGFSDASSPISTVRFFTTSASGIGKVSNDKIDIDRVIGYVQPTIPAEVPVTPVSVPEPATVALFGLGLLGFAAARRRSGKSRNA